MKYQSLSLPVKWFVNEILSSFNVNIAFGVMRRKFENTNHWSHCCCILDIYNNSESNNQLRSKGTNLAIARPNSSTV